MYDVDSSPFDYGTVEEGVNVINLTFPIKLDVFLTGFSPTVVVNSGNGINQGCRTVQKIQIPHLVEGLNASVQNTTCGTCNDGKIIIDLNVNAPCIQCTVSGTTKILNVNDLNTDLSSQNSAGTLPKGSYYVVATDVNTNCYIAFKNVVIQ